MCMIFEDTSPMALPDLGKVIFMLFNPVQKSLRDQNEVKVLEMSEIILAAPFQISLRNISKRFRELRVFAQRI